MALTPSFTITNNSGLSQNTFSITDTSTGTDGTVTKFVVFMYDVANNQLTGSPFTFTYSLNATYNLSVLPTDAAYNIVVQWQTAGSVVQATTSQIFAFTGYLELFNYGLIQQTSAQNRLLVDRDFLLNMFKLRVFIENANRSIDTGNSLFNAQAMILLAQNMQLNANLYF